MLIVQLKRKTLRTVLSGLLCGWAATASQADAPYFEKYGLTPSSPATDLGIQPIGVPSGVISAVMQRDRVLRAALQQAGAPLKAFAFRRGADIVPLLEQKRLEAGLLGDVPTLMATAQGNGLIAGLVKQSSTAIVAKGVARVQDLKGKRIGYVEFSSAHHTLLQGLRSAGLDEQQVTLVPLQVQDMPDALTRGAIDAFAAWQPAPATALAQSREHRIVFRALTNDYLVLEPSYVERHPEGARHVIASLIRAVDWMRRSRGHLEQAVRWAHADVLAFTGSPSSLSVEQTARIVREEILTVPAAPVIPERSKSTLLRGEFEFLQRLGKLPAGASWSGVEAALRFDGMARVLSQPRRYRLAEFDYASSIE